MFSDTRNSKVKLCKTKTAIRTKSAKRVIYDNVPNLNMNLTRLKLCMLNLLFPCEIFTGKTKTNPNKTDEF